MSCNASDGPSLLVPALALQNQQQFSNIQNIAGPSQSSPLASSSTLPTAEPSQPTPHTYGTRTRQNSVLKPTVRALYSNNTPLPASTLAVPLTAQTPSGSTLTFPVKKEQPKQRRIRPLAACSTPSSSSDDIRKPPTGVLKGILKGGKDAGRKPILQSPAAPPVPAIEFPPSHVVLHPDDASNKVFLAIGRAFMSVGNRAMTVKDLADLALKQGLACQNASAAAQAITFFVRSHLQRCEDEQDFPLLLRHVLSGTQKDDALVPALYSRLGGNVTHHHHHKGGSSAAANSSNASADAASATSPAAGQENQEKPQERLTSFRRGTTVWYLSRAAGAPCPFASAGIALRDYSECSGITGAESRRGATSSNTASGSGSANWTDDEGEGEPGGAGCRGLKRKRDGLRTRNASGAVVGGRAKSSEPATVDEDVREGRKPPKVKLTLKLRPPQSCLSVVSKPVVRDEQSDSSDSSSEDSDSDSESDGSMDVDIVDEPTPVKTTSSKLSQIQCQELPQPFAFPPFPLQRRISIPPYTPAEDEFPIASSSYRGWTAATPSFNTNFTWAGREPSVPLSVGSPPPDSDDEDFDMKEEDFEEQSPELNFVKKEEEIPFKFEWPMAPSSSSSSSSSSFSSPAADATIKTEEAFDAFNFFGTEPDDLGLGSLNLGFDNIKVEEDTDDLTAAYMRALASVMPSHSDDNDDGESIFDVDSVVHRAGEAVSPSVSEWRDADYGTGMAVPLTEPDFERDWAEAEASEGSHTGWESHVNVHPSTSQGQRLEQHQDEEEEEEEEERSSSPALTYAASSPADSSMSSSEMHDEDDDEEEDDDDGDEVQKSSVLLSPPSSSVPAFFGPELRDDRLGASLMSRRNTPSPSPSALLLSRTNSATGKPRLAMPMASSSLPIPIQQQRPPTIADTTDEDAVDAGSAPWERGMLTVADVEAHLLPALSPTYEYPMAFPLSSHFPFTMSSDGQLMEPPLSPQEQEVFQSFCVFDSPPPGVDGAPETGLSGDEPHDDAGSPKTAKRSSRTMAREKEADVVEESSKPLRRSRRVANAVASQQTAAVKARLRRRT
ncbi:hypothetical protein SCHPADRAFT_892152 [Schizopora paradoxa]|uniref:GDS1 winged helix domain-containing protein n=1 Tax=Schizopora paradoxa TaxID=27342 RepID=A0A0H2RFT5_9AGAM|nr:hypothetical protein SCHPADRAFT_892152 [Schizopora paradoxa]